MSYSKERLETAYSNVALLADGAWAVNDAYIRANQDLLLYESRLKIRMGLQRTVLDTIPESRLAHYGLYFYDEVRESCYTMDHPSKYNESGTFSKDEAWMTEEVDKIFHLMNDPNSKIKDIEKSCSLVIRELEEKEKRPNDKTFEVEKQLMFSGLGEDGGLDVHLRQLWEPGCPGAGSVLNVDVPEFFPKQHQDAVYECQHAHRQRHSLRRDYSFNSPSLLLQSPLYEPWLAYGYPVRAHEFRGLDSLVDELRLLPAPLLPSGTPPAPPARRLYSAVLQDTPSSTTAAAALDEDELERQAMEQYRRSEETIAAQYQELERLAEEQYQGCCGEQLSGNGMSPRRREAPYAAGRSTACHPALAAHILANTMLAIARLKLTAGLGLSRRFCHLR